MGESCNHIAALMYAVADITSKRKEGKLACTSIQQKWHVPRKRKISPKKAEQVNFRKYEVSCDDGTPTNPKKARTGLFKPLTETENKPNFTATVNIDRLAEKLKNTNLNIVWLTYFKKIISVFRSGFAFPSYWYWLPIFWSCWFKIRRMLWLLWENYVCHRNFSRKMRKIEVLTRGQAGNLLWHELKKQRITSLNFGTVCKLN